MSKGKITKFIQEFLKVSSTTPGFGQHLNKVREIKIIINILCYSHIIQNPKASIRVQLCLRGK